MMEECNEMIQVCGVIITETKDGIITLERVEPADELPHYTQIVKCEKKETLRCCCEGRGTDQDKVSHKHLFLRQAVVSEDLDTKNVKRNTPESNKNTVSKQTDYDSKNQLINAEIRYNTEIVNIKKEPTELEQLTVSELDSGNIDQKCFVSTKQEFRRSSKQEFQGPNTTSALNVITKQEIPYVDLAELVQFGAEEIQEAPHTLASEIMQKVQSTIPSSEVKQEAPSTMPSSEVIQEAQSTTPAGVVKQEPDESEVQAQVIQRPEWNRTNSLSMY